VVPEDVDIFRVVSYKDGKPVGKVITLTADQLNKRVQ
jgi:hypothetical protein